MGRTSPSHLRFSVILFVLVVLPRLTGSAPPPDADGKTPGKENRIVITIVYDNYPFDKRLETSWGFACVIDGFGERVLFDTGGDGRVLLANMRTLEIDPKTIDLVVLSHAHGDHTGGLDALLGANPKVRVFMPKAFPEELKRTVRVSGATLVETAEAVKVCEGISTTGVLGRAIAEQGIALAHPEGLIVVTGCAHPGIVALAAAAKKHADRPVFAALGGFHMGSASAARIDAVIEGLRKLGVRRVGPSHCSGDATRRRMKEAFGKDYLDSGLGARLVFEAERDPH